MAFIEAEQKRNNIDATKEAADQRATAAQRVADLKALVLYPLAAGVGVLVVSSRLGRL